MRPESVKICDTAHESCHEEGVPSMREPVHMKMGRRFWKGPHVPPDFGQVNLAAAEEPLRRMDVLSGQRSGDKLYGPPR